MPTLFVEADEPLLVFPSVEVAERYLEAPDVRSGTYPRAFGPSGEQFSITTTGEKVVITSLDAPVDEKGLYALLRRSLAAVGEPALEAAQLADLVAAAEAFWNERDPMDDRFSKPMPWWGCLLIGSCLIAIVMWVWR
jgi:hypothetical protein